MVVTAVGGYLVARHKASGTIDTTEAETLWAQSNALLDRYKDDLEKTRAYAATLETKVTTLASQAVTLEAKVVTLEALIQTLESKAVAVARKLADDTAMKLAINAAEVLAQPATGTAADKKARTEALAVARILAAKVKAEAGEAP